VSGQDRGRLHRPIWEIPGRQRHPGPASLAARVYQRVTDLGRLESSRYALDAARFHIPRPFRRQRHDPASYRHAAPNNAPFTPRAAGRRLGGIGAWAATSIGRVSPARAANGDPVYLGEPNSATSPTTVFNDAKNTAATFGTNSGIGVEGLSGSGVGVVGRSDSVQGIIGTGAIGVEGSSNNQYAWGVGGSNTAIGGIGVWGQATGSGSRGVAGYSAAGHALHGESSSGYAGYFAGKVYTSKFHEMKEISTPTAPGVNKARLFIRDNGSGKTQLCVRFHTGAVKVLATQP
jgi:hypothetical protein